MRIPLSWLKEFVNIDLAPEEIANTLTLAGLEVDKIEKVSLSAKGVVVAKVIESQKHPEAEKLTIAKVSDGKDVYQIVCGASNCRAGIKVALAKVDAILVDEAGKSFKIKKAKLRGVESFGMLCSAKELGIEEESDGILELDTHYPEGANLADFYEDVIFEISLTPNLGHCGSVIGVARELSAATKLPLTLPKVEIHEAEQKAASRISIKVLNTKETPRYAARVITGVQVGSSPDWLKKRLAACGLRSINNIVDVTNYVMLEFGHPLHAFDSDRLQGHQIIVKNARSGELFVTLDGKERVLDNADIVISDAVQTVAIGGVMGGQDSEVGNETRNIVLEAACFSPSSIRKTSKRLGMSTDASKKFERGCDPNALMQVLNRASLLIQQTAGGSILKGVIDEGLKEFPSKIIDCRVSRINTVLGTSLIQSEVESIFKRLEFVIKILNADTLSVQVPTYRNDINEEIDLVEEAARIFGFGNIKAMGVRYQSSQIPHDKMFLFEREIRIRILREGLQEFLTCDLIGPTLLGIVGENDLEMKRDDGSFFVNVLNPTSVEQSILRSSLTPGLLQVVKYNFDHQNPDVSGFEIGRIHFRRENKYIEESVLGIVMSGRSRPHHWEKKPHEVDFFDLKGLLENLFTESRVKDVSFKESNNPIFHPGRQATVYSGSLKIGTLGEVHPAVQRRLDVPMRILLAEINLHSLLEVSGIQEMMKPLPIFPGSERDLTLTLKESIPVESIFKAAYSLPSRYLENLSLIDVYRSDKLGSGLKNVTFRFFYRDVEKTMAQENVDAEHARIVQSIMLNIVLR